MCSRAVELLESTGWQLLTASTQGTRGFPRGISVHAMDFQKHPSQPTKQPGARGDPTCTGSFAWS